MFFLTNAHSASIVKCTIACDAAIILHWVVPVLGITLVAKILLISLSHFQKSFPSSTPLRYVILHCVAQLEPINICVTIFFQFALFMYGWREKRYQLLLRLLVHDSSALSSHEILHALFSDQGAPSKDGKDKDVSEGKKRPQEHQHQQQHDGAAEEQWVAAVEEGHDVEKGEDDNDENDTDTDDEDDELTGNRQRTKHTGGYLHYQPVDEFSIPGYSTASSKTTTANSRREERTEQRQQYLDSPQLYQQTQRWFTDLFDWLILTKFILLLENSLALASSAATVAGSAAVSSSLTMRIINGMKAWQSRALGQVVLFMPHKVATKLKAIQQQHQEHSGDGSSSTATSSYLGTLHEFVVRSSVMYRKWKSFQQLWNALVSQDVASGTASLRQSLQQSTVARNQPQQLTKLTLNDYLNHTNSAN